MPGNAVSGCIGSNRGYLLDTIGVDVHNTTRFETDDWRHAVTYGLDAFQDKVVTTDLRGTSEVTTPGGQRTVSGGFVQWKANYTSMLEVVGALRYDNYKLESATASSGGDRLSPKITVGLLPTAVLTPYVSYAEGYRAPSITETLVNGPHAGATVNDSFFRCPSGTPGPGADSTFCFLPNPNLRPEVGKNKEIGFNLKKNDLFTSGDSFRGKFNVFRNDITDFIDQVAFGPPLTVPTGPPPAPSHYRAAVPAVPEHRARPESRASKPRRCTTLTCWFVGLAGIVPGRQEPADRLWAVQHPAAEGHDDGRRSVARQNARALRDVDVGDGEHETFLRPTRRRRRIDLVNLYAQYQPTQDLTLNFSVENLLNQYYRPYAIPVGSSGDTQNDVKWASAGAGIVFKGGLRYHFGGS